MSTAAVFLDKDGTLIQNVPYNADPAKIQFAAGALSAVQLLHQCGFALYVISNQAGVALGLFPAQGLDAVAQRLRALLAASDVPLSGIYFCPHHPEGRIAAYTVACGCRKPQPGLLLRAAREHDIDLSRSWMIGDILDDIEAGRRAGCRTVLIDNGNETQWQGSPLRMPHILVHRLDQAAHAIARLSERQPCAFTGMCAV